MRLVHNDYHNNLDIWTQQISTMNRTPVYIISSLYKVCVFCISLLGVMAVKHCITSHVHSDRRISAMCLRSLVYISFRMQKQFPASTKHTRTYSLPFCIYVHELPSETFSKEEDDDDRDVASKIYIYIYVCEHVYAGMYALRWESAQIWWRDRIYTKSDLRTLIRECINSLSLFVSFRSSLASATEPSHETNDHKLRIDHTVEWCELSHSRNTYLSSSLICDVPPKPQK